jgi:hypothetical protein
MSLSRESLVAQLIAQAIRGQGGCVGVMIRDVPFLEPVSVARELYQLTQEGLELRIAYLQEDADAVLCKSGLPGEHVSSEIEQAERWRNQRNLAALIVVVATGTEDKLSSLEDFSTIVSGDLKQLLVRRALTGLATENEVQARWWTLLQKDESVSFGQLLEYYLSLADLTPAEVVTRSSRELHRLGLLPDPAFFDSPAESALRKRLDLNRDLVQRLQTFTDKDRKTAAKNLATVTDSEERARLNDALRHLKQLRRGSADLAGLTVRNAQALIDVRKPVKKGSKSSTLDEPKEKEPLSTYVASWLLEEPDAREGLDEVVQEVTEKLNSFTEAQLKTETVSIPSGSGGEITSDAKGDVVNLVAKLLRPGRYGALLEGGEGDLEAMIRRYHAKPQPITHWAREEIEPLLAAAEEIGAKQIGELFRAYDAARNDCLSLVRLLCVDPLAAAVAPSSKNKLRAVVERYQALLRGLRDAHSELSQELGADAQELVAQLLLLDTIVFRRSNDGLAALLAPTHPLYLWHYTEYARVVEEQRNRLSPRDRSLVVSAAMRLPYFLTSLCVPWIAVGATKTLTLVGRLGPLPMFGQTVRDRSGTDGMSQVKRVVSGFLDVHPTARLGLRLAVINAPDPGAFLSLLADLQGERKVEGAYLMTVHQARDGGRPRPLQLRPEEEERVAQLFRASGPWRRFTYQATGGLEGDLQLPPSAKPHILIVFDQSEGTANRVAPASHPIQPLAVTHKLQYRHRSKMLELTPAPGGIFAAYNQVVGIVDTAGQVSYFSVHQLDQLRHKLAETAEQATWFVVADRSVDRDLSLGALRVFTGAAEGRDVVAFTRRTDVFRRVLREVARQYNTAISDAELDELLRELADLLDEGIIALRPDTNGKANPQRVKGLLGMLIAVRAYRGQTPAGHERLVVSLDSAEARRWLHLREDAQRADLVGFDYADDRFTITVIEAKAVEDPSGEYQINDGIVNGAAIEQVLSTRRLLAQVFSPDREDELITTPARREVLREHAFRELTKATYSAEARKAWSERVEQLFEGSVPAVIHCEVAEVLLGRDSSSLIESNLRAREGEGEGADLVNVSIRQLNESGINALRQRTPSGPPDKPVPSGTEHAPEPVVPMDRRTAAVTTEGSASGEGPSEVTSGASAETEPAASWPIIHVEAKSPAAEPVERPRAYIGEAPGVYGKPREVWFDPQLPGKSLPNPHILITGETGSGKTQATKALIRDLGYYGVPSLILDFKDDYSQRNYAEKEEFTVFDASMAELAFDPMVPPFDPQTGRMAVMNHVYALGEIIKRIYSLGDQQANRMREALKSIYQQAGIRLQAYVPDAVPTFPFFDQLKEVLEAGKDSETLLGRLSPIFDLGLFTAAHGQGGFEEIARQPTVIRLSQLPGDETKNAVAELFLMALYNYLIRQPHPHALRQLLVLDEAWRLVKSPFLQPLMREGRAFGLGVIVATQFPKDMPDEVSGSTATKLYFSQTKPENIREVQRALIGKTSGADADHLAAAVRELPPLTCFVQNGQYQPYARTVTHPYYARVSGT